MEEEKEFICHFEKQEQDTLFRKVLSGKSSFNKEIREFYGLDVDIHRAGRGGYSYVVKEIIENRSFDLEVIPKNLIKIVEPFCDKELTLNENKLTYGSVREDYAKSKNGKYLPLIPVLGTPLAGGIVGSFEGGLGAAAGLAFQGLVVGAFSGAIMLGLADKRISSDFYNLCWGAKYADRFMEHSYRTYFIRKSLKN